MLVHIGFPFVFGHCRGQYSLPTDLLYSNTRCGKSVFDSKFVQTAPQQMRVMTSPNLPIFRDKLIEPLSRNHHEIDHISSFPAEHLPNPDEPTPRYHLADRQRLAERPTVNCLLGRVDCPCTALGDFPIALVGPSSLVLRVVNLMMSMKTAERITTQLPQNNDLVLGIVRVLNLYRGILPRSKRVVRAAIMDFHGAYASVGAP